MIGRLALLACAAAVPLACTGDIGVFGGDDGPTPACPLVVGDLAIAEAVLAEDGSTAITLAWSAIPGASGYRIERAAAGADAWTEIAAPAAGVETFADPAPLTADARYRIVTLAGDCAQPGAAIDAFAVERAQYGVPGQRVPTVGFSATVGGLVRYPRSLASAAGPRPLVLILHGNHGICRRGSDEGCPDLADSGPVDNTCPIDNAETIPNAAGYVYLQDTLAARGYITASIDANAFNCRDDFVPERAQLIVQHLRQWAKFAAAGGAAPLGATFADAVDLEHVGLLGHSRGGAAVSLVPAILAGTPVDGVTVASVFALAPSGHATPRPTEVPYTVLVPSCDGDVWNLEGIAIYDRVRSDATAVARSQLFFIGANHNGFNTVWTSDDNDDAEQNDAPRSCAPAALAGGSPERARAAQEATLELAAGAWFDATLRGAPLPAFFRAEAESPSAWSAWAGTALDLRASYIGAERRLIDDFTRGGQPPTNLLGLANSYQGFDQASACSGPDCDRGLGVCAADGCAGQVGRCQGDGCDVPYELWHDGGEVSALALSWSTGDGQAIFSLGDLDLTAYGALSFRIAAADSDLNASTLGPALSVRATDSAGHAAVVPLSDLRTLPSMYETRAGGDLTANVRAPKEVLQTLRVPAEVLAAAGRDLDLAHLATVELTSDGGGAGAVFVTDLAVTD